MKFEPLTKKDFTDKTRYESLVPLDTDVDRKVHKKPSKNRSYADILNDLGNELFSDFDCFNMTETQLIELNRLIQLGEQIINTYVPQQDPTNINLVTFPAYLFKAVREFNISHVSQERLKAAREREDTFCYGRYGRAIRIFLHSDICPDYLPRRVKSQLRENFKREYGVYPENIFIAVVFYITPYILEIKPAQQGYGNGILRILLDNIESVLHHQKCGAHKKIIQHPNLDDKYEILKHNVLAGKYCGNTAYGIVKDIRTTLELSHRQAVSLVTRFNDEHNIKRITNLTKK